MMRCGTACKFQSQVTHEWLPWRPSRKHSWNASLNSVVLVNREDQEDSAAQKHAVWWWIRVCRWTKSGNTSEQSKTFHKATRNTEVG